MKERLFRFKGFSVRHHKSAMKVGVDGVLLGAWASVPASGRVLDVGTGCGLIALMCARRSENIIVDAIDTDRDSVEEAAANFADSPWHDRLHASLADFSEWDNGKYRLMISNPPFFDAGVDASLSPRLAARHVGQLSPVSLLSEGRDMLEPDGRIALIAPAEMADKILEAGVKSGLSPVRRLMLFSKRDSAHPKRVLLEMGFGDGFEIEESTLCIEERAGIYTPEYIALTRDFYLNF